MMRKHAAALPNPWLSLRAAEATATPIQGPTDTCESVPERWEPQLGVEPAARALARVSTPDDLALWVVGTHGGAGESTLAGLLERGRASDHCWPLSPSGAPRWVVLTARTHAYGLASAQAALREWSANQVACVLVVGLVLIADAPGRLPRALDQQAQLVAGGAPRAWRVPYLESWRLQAEPPDMSDRSVRRLVSDLDQFKLSP